MGKIFYVMGKSSSGKDTVFKQIGLEMPELRKIVLYTTRPIREGERDGIEYSFVDEETLRAFERAGKVIELRSYNTVHGIWSYFTADDGQINLDCGSYLGIGTLESYEGMCRCFGKDLLVPVYIEVEDGERLLRAIGREKRQQEPKYAEMCRRFLADTEDFSEVKLKRLGIAKHFSNREFNSCMEEILLYIHSQL